MNDFALTCRCDADTLTGRIVALTGNVVDGALEVTKAAVGDVLKVIGITDGEALAGGLINVIPLGRGARVKVALAASEAVSVGDLVGLSSTDGLAEKDGAFLFGIALGAATSASDANALVEVLTGFFPTALES